MRCSALQCVAVCCVAVNCSVPHSYLTWSLRDSALQCVAVRCSALQCVAVHCSVLCCSELQCASFVFDIRPHATYKCVVSHIFVNVLCHTNSYFASFVSDMKTYVTDKYVVIHKHNICNAGNRMDFTKGNFKPESTSSILQALSCRFFGCNLLFLVFLAFKICLCFVLFINPPRDFSKQGRARFRQRQARGLLTRKSIGEKPPSIVYK